MSSNSPPPALATPADLHGRRALVTGAASGIGAAIVGRYLACGAQVYAVDRDEAGLKTLVGRFPTDGPRLVPLVADLADLTGLADLPTDVDVLVNNAGLQHIAPVEDFPLDRFELILAVMLHAPFRLVRQCLPHMYARGWGRVVNVSSAHGRRASAFKSAYVTAKHGLEGLSKVVALEGAAHGVTSNCISPGYVRTPLVEKQIAEQAATRGIAEDEVIDKVMLEAMAVKRLVEPQEVAELAAFLCGPSSLSITGASIAMDGGWTAR
ncbi:3-hydroxybutyrate dehydrogenase [Lapillicoccus sp.]|uniref:3-hydroxybutyrate dehydrogenase n=1 Tax=Lapillicoccus sp. TaxID=1909287 RepID=UPI0027C748EA|nr:3-hydroxybutyrate dehydrogenase [Actinomycetota bacterium]